MTEDSRRAALGSCLHRGLRVVGNSRATTLAYAVIDLTLETAWPTYLDAVLQEIATAGLEGALRHAIRVSLPYTSAANSALRQTLEGLSSEDWATLVAYAADWDADAGRAGARSGLGPTGADDE